MKKYITLISSTIFLIVLYINCNASNNNNRIYLLTAEKGVLISYDNGDDWDEFNRGLPDNFIPLKIISDYSGNLYLATLSSGLFKLKKDSEKWKSLNSEILKTSYTETGNGYRKITALYVSNYNKLHIIIAQKHKILFSKNGGNTWSNINLKGLNKRNYITAITLKGKNNTIIAGTSFKGIFIKKNNRKFKSIRKGLPGEPFSKKTVFIEEVSELYTTKNSNELYAGFAFSRGIYKYNGKKWVNLFSPVKGKVTSISSIFKKNKTLFIAQNKKIFSFKNNQWSTINIKSVLKNIPNDKKPIALFLQGNKLNNLFLKIENYMTYIKRPIKNSGNRKGIYTNPYSLKKKMNYYIRTLKSTGMDSITIDMKDDYGHLYYPSKIKTAKTIRALRGRLKIKKILKKFKDNKIYTIARVVVFKDRTLFRGLKKKYAIRDKRTGKPWRGTPGEYWVDPHSDFVQNYNIDIAKELEEIGFDEIQFDYIRFPSDGGIHNCRYKFREKKDTFKSEVLVKFLSKAKRALKIPISTDIYGFTSWYRGGNWIGQDMEAFAEVVDVICPMVYPSHYGNRFLSKGPRRSRSYRVVYKSGIRARAFVSKSIYIRPYIQAFNLLSPTWGTGYIRNQTRASRDSGTIGYTFWNAAGEYKTVKHALKKSKK